MKNLFFQLKKAYKQIFFYPAIEISNKNVDYDEYWKDKRGDRIGSISSWQKERADIVLEQMDKSHPAVIMDIGCADGSVLKYIKEKTAVSKAIGVDVSLLALTKAKEFGIETIHADINDIKNFDTIPSTDYILLLEVLEHIQDSEIFLKHMLRKAQKGVFFSFPNTGFCVHRLRLMFGKFPLQWRVHPGEHVRFWTNSDLVWWLKALRIKSYKISYYEGVPLLNKIIPSLFAAGFVVYIQK